MDDSHPKSRSPRPVIRPKIRHMSAKQIVWPITVVLTACILCYGMLNFGSGGKQSEDKSPDAEFNLANVGGPWEIITGIDDTSYQKRLIIEWTNTETGLKHKTYSDHHDKIRIGYRKPVIDVTWE